MTKNICSDVILSCKYIMLNFRKEADKMKHINNELSEQHKELIKIIKKKDKINEAIELFLDLMQSAR